MFVVKWWDNEAVHLASNFAGVEPMDSVERWCNVAKEKKQIPCPRIVKLYNSGMGGVDLADMFLSLYRIRVKTRRWYLKIFWHCVEVHTVWHCVWHYCQGECLAIVLPPLQHLESTEEEGDVFIEIQL